MRYKNWKMRQVSSVLVINHFLLNVLTLSIPKTALYDTLAKFFFFTMAMHLSILWGLFFPPSYVLILIISAVFECCHVSEEYLSIYC